MPPVITLLTGFDSLTLLSRMPPKQRVFAYSGPCQTIHDWSPSGR